MTAVAVVTERVELRFAEVDIAMLRVADLAPHVDGDRLLGMAEADEPPYWMHLWPGATSLARRLAQGPPLDGARVLELGCGMGLPSLVAARRGAEVVATDRLRPPLVMARDSARVNQLVIAVVQMDWRACATGPQFDLVLGADIAYDASEEASLVAAVAGSLRPGGRILLADSVNTYRVGFADKLAAAGFAVRESKSCEREDGRAIWVRCLEGART